MEIGKKYVAEYNPIQNIFHIQTLENTIQGNFRCVSEGWAHDYLLMGIFDHYQDANRFCDEMKKNLEKRNLSRPTTNAGV